MFPINMQSAGMTPPIMPQGPQQPQIIDPRAQYEIRVFAEVIAGMVKRVAPLSYEAWVDYDLGGEPLSLAERTALARLVQPEGEGIRVRDGVSLQPDQLAELGLSAREIREFIDKLQPPARPDFELDLSSMRSADEMSARMIEAVPEGFE